MTDPTDPGASGDGVRADIALSWRRAELAGLGPGMEVTLSVLSNVDRRSRLVRAAEPVLNRMAQRQADLHPRRRLRRRA